MAEGLIKKMVSQLADPVQYHFSIDGELLSLNDQLGQTIKLKYLGEILCGHCGRKTKKSYSQGFCYVCMQRLAQCDMCILKPETCHYHLGTCREPSWGDENCFIDHYVYLANSSGLKVGITRHSQVPTRWIDQGASQALPIMRVKSRLQSGLIETALKAHVADKTDWRKMLKGEPTMIDLAAERDRLLSEADTAIDAIIKDQPQGDIERLDDSKVVNIRYPVLQYPEKVRSLNLEKTPEIEGTLEGIKGQYLIFDIGVINIRKYTSYKLGIEFS